MTETADTRNPRDFYIIDTRTKSTEGYVGQTKNPGRNWAEWELTNNAEYKNMVGMRGEKLKKAMAETGVELAHRGRPENFHGKEHLTPDVANYFTENGFVWIHKDKIDDAKRVMLELRKLDPQIEWNPMGLTMTEEELKKGLPVAPGGGAGTRGGMVPGLNPGMDARFQEAPPSKLMGGR